MKTRTRLTITNLPRGFVRLWLMMSVAWIIGVGVDIGAAVMYIGSNPPNPFEQIYPDLFAAPSPFTEVVWLGGLLIGPPAAILLMGIMLGGAAKRF
jgi:hypothetical protein